MKKVLELQLRGIQFSLEIRRSIFLISISVEFLLYYHCIYTGPVLYQVETGYHQAIQFLCCAYNHYHIPVIPSRSLVYSKLLLVKERLVLLNIYKVCIAALNSSCSELKCSEGVTLAPQGTAVRVAITRIEREGK